MEAQFGKNSTQFATAAKNVANLKDQFSEFNQSVQAFNPDNKLQALVGLARGATGALQGATGAMAFLGIESGKSSEIIAKLQGLMAFSQALNSVDDIKNSFKNFGTVIQSMTVFQKANAAATNLAAGAMRLFGISVEATSTGFKVLKAAIISTGIGLLIIGVTALIQKISEWVSSTGDAEKAQEKLKKAVTAVNESLSIQQGMIEHETKLNEERLKQSGATEEQLYQNKVDGLSKQFEAERNHENKLRALYNNKKLTDEERADAQKELNQAILNQVKISNKLEEESESHKTKIYEDGVKKSKEASDKAEAQRKANADKAKAASDKANAERKQALEELAKIEKKAIQGIEDSKLSAREKELHDLQIDFDETKAKYVKYGKDITNITTDYNIHRLEIEQKYKDEIKKAIDEVTLNEYDKQRDAINEKYDVLLKNAKTFADQIAVEGLRVNQLGNVDTEQTVKTNTVNSETNLINTQVDNAVNKNDTPEQRVAKLQAVYDAEKNLKAAQLAEELSTLENDEAAKANVLAKYRQDELQSEKELSDAKKAISDAEKAAKLSNLETVSKAAGDLSNLIGQQTVAGKALAVAQATIDTYAGASKALAQGGFLGIAQAAIVTAAGILNVKKILSTKVPVKNGSGGSTSAPALSAPQINSTMLQADLTKIQDVRVINQKDQVVKAYISQNDLQANQDQQAFLKKLGSF
jgi:hypothetical protein